MTSCLGWEVFRKATKRRDFGKKRSGLTLACSTTLSLSCRRVNIWYGFSSSREYCTPYERLREYPTDQWFLAQSFSHVSVLSQALLLLRWRLIVDGCRNVVAYKMPDSELAAWSWNRSTRSQLSKTVKLKVHELHWCLVISTRCYQYLVSDDRA
jgi:hypothetical protein